MAPTETDGSSPDSDQPVPTAARPTAPLPGEAVGDKVLSTQTAEMLQRLARAPRLDLERYAIEGEVDRGGMGAILRIHDRQLNRRLAMKVLLDRPAARDDLERQLAHQVLGRFLEEAQVTAQLDHPGVVPVHELGLDQHGKVYFTMRLVKGRTAGDVFTESHQGSADWPLTRALEIVLKVCDTMGYAHSKGVLHRDLKPANVMVGRFGEVYVMDWGLAKVLGQDEPRGAPTRTTSDAAMSRIDSARQRDADLDDTASVASLDGQKIGTPSYMPPEQARGETLDPRADVYAIGAMLYELLAGTPPYAVPGLRKPAHRILEDVVLGPPRRIDELVKGVPAELVAIVDTAMARDRDDRYADTLALAGDLRAFLATRAVQAYRTGPLVELALWIKRNRPLAASLLAAVLLLCLGVVGTTWLANENAALAEEKGRTVANFHQLSGVVRLRAALANQAKLWPAWPDREASLQAWIDTECTPLLAMRADLEATLAELRQHAMATMPGSPPSPAEPAAADRMQPRPWQAKDTEGEAARFLHDALVELQSGLTTLQDQQKPDVERRLAWAKQVGAASRAHPKAHVTWAAARQAIARADDVVASARYAGQSVPLRDEDVVGLVPIGMNPVTKLWEFYDLGSAWNGTTAAADLPIPQHAADGTIAVEPGSGIVFVLLPGAVATLGSQADDASTPGHDPERQDDEGLHEVTLAPFLLARHELTQAQWARLWTFDTELQQPSLYAAGDTIAGGAITATHPVEQVDWTMCDLVLTRHGMALPTEAQWEYACRAGTRTPWHVPRDQLRAFANVADRVARAAAPQWGAFEDWDDGHVVHAPVGSFAPNGFGLFDMHGNVSEWCREPYGLYGSERPGDGLRATTSAATYVYRGGSCDSPASIARSADRNINAPSFRFSTVGVRAARSLTK